MIKRFIAYLPFIFFPFIVLAQGTAQFSALEQTVKNITDAVKALIPLFVALAFIYFFYGVGKYVRRRRHQQKKKRGVL